MTEEEWVDEEIRKQRGYRAAYLLSPVERELFDLLKQAIVKLDEIVRAVEKVEEAGNGEQGR